MLKESMKPEEVIQKAIDQAFEVTKKYYESNAYIEQLIRDGRIEIDVYKALEIVRKQDWFTGSKIATHDDMYKTIEALNQPALLKVKEK